MIWYSLNPFAPIHFVYQKSLIPHLIPDFVLQNNLSKWTTKCKNSKGYIELKSESQYKVKKLKMPPAFLYITHQIPGILRST